MAEAVIGTWKNDSAENLDNYMKALGVPDQLREVANSAKPILEISRDGNVWVIKTTVGDKVSESKYPENVETDSKSLIGQPIKVVLTPLPNGIREVQKLGDADATVTRVVENGVMVSTLSVKGVDAILRFSKA